MSLNIKLNNKLDPSQEKSFYAIKTDPVYYKIAEELKCKPHCLLVYYGDEILEREMKFKNLDQNSILYLSYVNGNDFNKKNQSISMFTKPENNKFQLISDSTKFVESQVFSSFKSEIQNGDNILKFQRDQYLEKIEKIDEIIQRKTFKLSQMMNESNDLFQSQMVEQNSICRYCELQIELVTFQTDCQHSFHPQCLESIVDTQIQINNPKLFCLCNKEIKLKLLFNLISNQIEASLKQNYFLQNQLKSIKEEKNQNTMNCQGKCGFFYFDASSLIQAQSFCSICNKVTQFTVE